MSARRALVATALLTLMALSVTGGSAGAGPACMLGGGTTPDGQISPGIAVPYIGQNIYNRGGADQTVFAELSPGENDFAFVISKNNDDSIHDIVVTAAITGDTSAFRVKISNFNATKDWTDQFLRPTGRRFRDVADGAFTPDIRIRVKKFGSAPVDAELKVRFRASFDSLNPCFDTVKSVLEEPA